MEPLPASSVPAPYGRSCTNCSRAKCRCIYAGGASGSNCERCRRLNRECVPSVYARKKTAKRATGSRTAQLEQKLDDLVSILKNQTVSKPFELPHGKPPCPADDVGDTPPQSVSSSSAAPSEATPPHDPNAAAAAGPPVRPGSSSGDDWESVGLKFCPDVYVPREFEFNTPGIDDPDGPAAILSAMPCPGEPSGREAEQALEWFRTAMSPFLPFVYLPPGTTSQKLRAEKPFTWLNVMYIATSNVQRQLMLAQSIKQIVANKVVVDEVKNLDILLGLLVFTGWMQLQPHGKKCLGTFIAIAQSVVYDLSIHEQLRETPPILAFKFGKLPKGRPPPKERTMDERRAVLMFYMQTSSCFTSLKRIEPLKWNSHLDECLQMLQDRAEYDGDVILAGLVRLQLIAENTHRAQQQQNMDSSSRRTPVGYIEALLAQLERVRDLMPLTLRDNAVFLKYYHHTALRIHELHLPRPLPSLSQSVSTTAEPDMARFNALHACLQTMKAWFATFFSLPQSAYIGLSFPCYSHMAHCLIALHKLSVVQDAAWDRAAARRELDLFEVCDRIEADLDFVVREYRPGCGESDLFVKCGKALKSFRALWWADLMGGGNSNAKGDARAAHSRRRSLAQLPENLHTPATTPSEGEAAMPGLMTGVEAFSDVDIAMFAGDDWLANIFNQGWEVPMVAR